MRPAAIIAIQHDDEKEKLSRCTLAKLEAVWADLELTAPLRKIPQGDAEETMFESLLDFTSEQAIIGGMTKDDYMRNASASFDQIMEEKEEERSEDDEALTVTGA